MEEKKNNKGLIIGLIIFLIMCLILVFYFMFKMVYKEPSTNLNEASNTETNNNDSVVFTELTKYELKDGEEKEVTIDGKKVNIKRNDNKYNLNDKEIGHEYTNSIYVTNKCIITSNSGGQFEGNFYEFYQFDGTEIEIVNNNGILFKELSLENGKLIADGEVGQYLFDFISLGNLSTTPCITGNEKKLSEYPEVIDKYKDEITKATYEFVLKNNKIELNVEKVISTLNRIVEDSDSICVYENNN